VSRRRAAEKGYKPGRKVLVLDFTGTEHEGLEVRCRAMRFGQMMDLARGDLLTMANEVRAAGTVSPDQLAQMDDLFGLFAEALISWNLLDDETGDPVPTTLDGLWSQDVGLALLVFQMWVMSMSQVTAPLDVPSSSGAPSQVGSLPMAPKSPSPPN
jgi:hypothetical protein